LIGIGGGATLFTRKDVGLSSSKIVGEEDAPPAPQTPPPAQQPASKPAEPQEKQKEQPKPEEKAAEKKKPTRPLPLPGAAFRTKLDLNHFLSYGHGSDTLVVLFSGDQFFERSKDGANVATFDAGGSLLVSGFEWPDNTEELLKGTAYLIDEPTGRGHVILFAEDPLFRYLWRSSSQLLMNAILLAPALR
jgi:hypothetical protein